MSDGANAAPAAGVEPPRWGRRLGGLALWSLAAVMATMAAACVCSFVVARLPYGSPVHTLLGMGSLSGVLLGLVVGIRSGRLGFWAFGPTLGLAVGVLDLKIFGWIVGRAWLSPTHASWVPTWGLLLGLLAALPRRRALPVVGIALGAALAQCGTAVFWTYAVPGLQGSNLFRALCEGLVYAPAAIVIVLGCPRK